MRSTVLKVAIPRGYAETDHGALVRGVANHGGRSKKADYMGSKTQS